MLALCLMLLGTYYAQNYAGIIGRSLYIISRKIIEKSIFVLLCLPLYIAPTYICQSMQYSYTDKKSYQIHATVICQFLHMYLYTSIS